MQPLQGKNIVGGVTGGIACYKACDVVSWLRKQGANVFVIMTKNATEFVTPMTFETLCNNPAMVDTFQRPLTWEVEHIALAKRADVFLIAPATANILAKMAHGIADDMLSTTVLATNAPILVAPAMNTGMWDNVATKENVKVLLNRGVQMIGPEGGYLACGDSGMGRMSEPFTIVETILAHFQSAKTLQGLKVLVTAGATREMLDPVRYLTNKSSGKMGYALAEVAAQRGAEVTLVTGGTTLPIPKGVKAVPVVSTQDLFEQMVALAPLQDVVIQAAAPADFRAKTISTEKIKKQGESDFFLELEQTPDVAKAIGIKKRQGQTFVAFAAETHQVLAHAKQKMQSKNVDMMVANDVTKKGAGFDIDTNIVSIITETYQHDLPLLTKKEVAGEILDRIAQMRNEGRETL